MFALILAPHHNLCLLGMARSARANLFDFDYPEPTVEKKVDMWQLRKRKIETDIYMFKEENSGL